jgi:hypothetical protein
MVGHPRELEKGKKQIEKTKQTLDSKQFCIQNPWDKKCRKSGFEEMFNHSIVPANSNSYSLYSSTSSDIRPYTNYMSPEMYNILKTRGGNAL